MDPIIEHLKELRKNCYAPGSNFHVSAIVRNEDDEYFDGVNVENASYGLTNCAERSAIFSMVSQVGYKRIKEIWIMAGLKDDDSSESFAYPCGACRQVIAEFAYPHDTLVHLITCNGKGHLRVPIQDLLPNSFKFSDFK